jgi:general secretion pathway protein D
MIRTLISATLALGLVCFAAAQTPRHISFSDVNIATVLKGISMQTGANIVFVGAKEGDAKITLDINVSTAEEAVKAAVSAAGLAYRKVNGTYIVASPTAMRRALEPYSTKARYAMPPGIAAKVQPKVQEAFPDATVQVMGEKLVFTGLMEDIRESRGIIAELQALEEDRISVNEVVSIARSNPADIVKMIGVLYPDLKIGSAGDEKGGAITISGPMREVKMAVDFAMRVDAVVQSAPEAVFRVYEIKYSSAPKMETFMKDAAKDVEVFIAPESYSPVRANFSPLGSQIASAAGGGNSGSGGQGTGQNNGTNQSGAGTSQGAGGQGGTSAEEKGSRSKRLVLRGSPERLDSAIRLLESIDLKPMQVLVEVNVVETSPSLVENTGFNWNWSPIDFFEAAPGTVIEGFNSSTRRAGAGTFSRAPVSFGSILQAQVKKGEAKILANPKVQVIDNDGASIFIGDTIRAKVTTTGPLGAQTIQIEEFPIGIILLIHPRINADGNITMHVNPVVSTVTDIGSDNIPQTSSREADTTVIVKDGETIVLGGLIRDEYSKTITEVPFLSKLPIIGELFRNRSKNHRRTEVIVTITPHVMKG